MGKLLLKCDGVLVEKWNPVEDGPPPEVIPAVWDAPQVTICPAFLLATDPRVLEPMQQKQIRYISLFTT
jgi:hypothetical protein